VPVIPKVSLPDYRAITAKIEKKSAIVEEKDIEETLKWLQKSRAKTVLKNGSAEKGDLVDIEYSCPQIPEITQEKAQKDAFVLGEGKFIPGFEENIIGMVSNEEKTFSIEANEDHFPEALKGKKLEFTVKVGGIQKIELPEISDDFVKTIGKFETVEDLKANITEGIKIEKEEAEKQKTRARILEEISKESKVEIPEILIERERETMMENMKHEVSHKFNIPFEQYLKQINKTEADIISSLTEEAKDRVKKFLILREIGNKEKVEVSDSKIEEETNKTLKQYATNSMASDKKYIERLKEYNKGVLKNEKIFNILEGALKK
jgi:trigger factor